MHFTPLWTVSGMNPVAVTMCGLRDVPSEPVCPLHLSQPQPSPASENILLAVGLGHQGPCQELAAPGNPSAFPGPQEHSDRALGPRAVKSVLHADRAQ